MTLKLYFVAHHDGDGNNRDLFVWAETQEAVVGIWQEWCGFDEDDNESDERPTPETIFEIPTTAMQPGYISWSTIKRNTKENDE
jgi:hypothetical protein